MANFHITIKSENSKVGKIPVSSSSRDTCPDSCPFRATADDKACGCYGESGPISWLWDKVDNGVMDKGWKELIRTVSALKEGMFWRHNQVGDLPHNDQHIDADMLNELVEANKGKMGYTYTHHDLAIDHNRAVIEQANKRGFIINLSADTLAEADAYLDLKIGPVVVTLPPEVESNRFTTPGGNVVVVCPEQTGKMPDCDTCRLCAHPKRKVIIGFLAHGTKKAVQAVLDVFEGKGGAS